jgi:hypothetical protein
MLHAGFFLAYSMTLEMEVICSSETFTGFDSTARCYIPEDGTLHSFCRENLKSNITILIICTNESLTQNKMWSDATTASYRPTVMSPELMMKIKDAHQAGINYDSQEN